MCLLYLLDFSLCSLNPDLKEGKQIDLMHGRIRELGKCVIEMGTLAFNKMIPQGNILNKHLNSSAATVINPKGLG